MTTVRSNSGAAICAGEPLSVRLKVIGKNPAVVGVPLIVPVAGSSVMPVGRAPLVMDQVKGAVPPVVAGVDEYSVPLMASIGSFCGVVTVSLSATLMLRCWVADSLGVVESVASTTNEEVPAVV